MVDRRIILLVLGLFLIGLSVLPYVTKAEILATTPSGWEIIGSQIVKFPRLPKEQVYDRNGVPTGIYDCPVDHGWFAGGKPVEIGGTVVTLLDTFQDDNGCHLKVSVGGREGLLTLRENESVGVQLDGSSLYIRRAKPPPRKGLYLRANGEIFYGFEEVELVLYRMPTPVEIPVRLAVPGAVFLSGLSLLGFRRRRTSLACLAGGVVFVALLIVMPGGAGRQPIATYARLDWVGTDMHASADEGFNRFLVLSDDNFTVFDRWGNPVCSWNGYWYNSATVPIRMSGNGSRAVSSGAFEWKLWDCDTGVTVLGPISGDMPVINWGGDRIAYRRLGDDMVVLCDDLGNMIAQVQRDTTPDRVWISRGGDRFAATWTLPTLYRLEVYDSTGQTLWSLENVQDASFDPDFRYALVLCWTTTTRSVLRLYEIDTGKLIYSTPEETELPVRPVAAFSRDGTLVGIVTLKVQRWDATYTPLDLIFRVLRISDNTVLSTHSLGQVFRGRYYAVSPSVQRVVVTGADANYSPSMVSLGVGGWSGILPVPKYTLPISCTENEVLLEGSDTAYGWYAKEVFVVGWRYRLVVSSPSEFQRPDGLLVGYYENDLDPGSTFLIHPALPADSAVGFEGNLTAYDNIGDVEATIYMDNNKTVRVRVVCPPVSVSVSPPEPSTQENVVVSWQVQMLAYGLSDADFFELQIDNEEGFPHPASITVYSQGQYNSFTLEPPSSGWSYGTYWVRLRSVAVVRGESKVSGWCDPVSFTVPTPPPAGPVFVPLMVVPPLPMAVSLPVAPYPTLAVFNALGQVAGIYTFSILLMVLGLGLIVASLVRRW